MRMTCLSKTTMVPMGGAQRRYCRDARSAGDIDGPRVSGSAFGVLARGRRGSTRRARRSPTGFLVGVDLGVGLNRPRYDALSVVRWLDPDNPHRCYEVPELDG